MTEEQVRTVISRIKQDVSTLLQWKTECEEGIAKISEDLSSFQSLLNVKSSVSTTSGGDLFALGWRVFQRHPNEKMSLLDLTQKIIDEENYEITNFDLVSLSKDINAACVHKLLNLGKIERVGEFEGKPLYKKKNK